MFVAFSKVFTPENLLYFAKGAVVSLLLAAVSLLFGIVFVFDHCKGCGICYKVCPFEAISFGKELE